MQMQNDLFPRGYGRSWSEPKASGIRRFFQIMREPITFERMMITFVFVIAAEVIVALIIQAAS